MESISKAKTVVDFYVLCNSLKNIIRTGWKNWNVKRERIESVAEHIFGVQSLAIAMWSQYRYDIDIYKVIFMIAVHELEEIIIGDLTQWDITPDEKINQGHNAVQLILKNLLEKEQIQELVYEFDARQTKEALFAYHCDKLEGDIQSKLYDEERCVDLTKQDGNPTFNDERVQKFLKIGKAWSEMWINFGRNRYNYDPNFTEVSEYVEKNNISLQKKIR
jgi:putative hydrolase of HD superfamily